MMHVLGFMSNAFMVQALPRHNTTLNRKVPSVQWAAVRIHSSLMTVAPQKTEELPLQTMPTCHGHSLTSVSWPPTILVFLWARPQVQSDEPVPLPPVGGRGVAPDPDPEPPVADPDPVGGIVGIPEPPVPMSLGIWTQTHPELP